MNDILIRFSKDIWSIIHEFFRVIWNELVFRSRAQNLGEQVAAKMKGRDAMIRSQQDQLAYQAGSIQANGHEISGLKNLLTHKDKEAMSLKKDKRSLEFRLREQTFRNKRRR